MTSPAETGPAAPRSYRRARRRLSDRSRGYREWAAGRPVATDDPAMALGGTAPAPRDRNAGGRCGRLRQDGRARPRAGGVLLRPADRDAGDHRHPRHRPRPGPRRHPVQGVRLRGGRARGRPAALQGHDLQVRLHRPAPRRRQGGAAQAGGRRRQAGAAAILRAVRAAPRRALRHRPRPGHLGPGDGRHRPRDRLRVGDRPAVRGHRRLDPADGQRGVRRDRRRPRRGVRHRRCGRAPGRRAGARRGRRAPGRAAGGQRGDGDRRRTSTRAGPRSWPTGSTSPSRTPTPCTRSTATCSAPTPSAGC